MIGGWYKKPIFFFLRKIDNDIQINFGTCITKCWYLCAVAWIKSKCVQSSACDKAWPKKNCLKNSDISLFSHQAWYWDEICCLHSWLSFYMVFIDFICKWLLKIHHLVTWFSISFNRVRAVEPMYMHVLWLF